MSLIIEDGSIVADANSYVTIDEARSYATARGLTLPASDADLTAQLISSIDYLEAQRARYQGTKVSALQVLQFPRYNVVIDGIEQDPTLIPSILKQAQIRLAIEANSGVTLMPTRSGGFIVEDTVGPITTKYSDKVAVSIEPEITAVDALLQPLYGAPPSVGFLKTYRA
jgi:hypothetical protein